MSLKHAHSFSRGLTRASCAAAVVALCAFGFAASADAATTHFGPIGAPVAVGEKPVAVAVDDNLNSAGHKKVYVVNSDGNSISVLDAHTHAVTTTIPLATRLGVHPSALAVNYADDLIFVTEEDDDSVAIIDGQTNTVLTKGHVVGAKPDAIAWDSANGRMYVANYGDGTILAIDDKTGAQIGTPVAIGSGGTTSKPEGIGVDRSSGLVVVAAQGDNKVYVVDYDSGNSAKVTGTFASPNAVAVNGDGTAFIANFDNDTVSAVDVGAATEVVGSPVAVGHNPNAIAINDNTDAIYVANFNSSISIITPSGTSTPPTVATVELPGDKPSGIAVDSGASGEVFATNQGAGLNSVSILGTTVSPTITSGAPGPATVGTSYNFPFTATGTPSTITFSVTGSLPAGISLLDGALVGSPTQSGDFTFTLHASNGVDPEATMTYTLHVDPAAVTTPTPTPTPTTPGGHLPQVAG